MPRAPRGESSRRAMRSGHPLSRHTGVPGAIERPDDLDPGVAKGPAALVSVGTADGVVADMRPAPQVDEAGDLDPQGLVGGAEAAREEELVSIGKTQPPLLVGHEAEVADGHVLAAGALEVVGDRVRPDEDPVPVAVAGLVRDDDGDLPRGLVHVEVGRGGVVGPDRACPGRCGTPRRSSAPIRLAGEYAAPSAASRATMRTRGSSRPYL